MFTFDEKYSVPFPPEENINLLVSCSTFKKAFHSTTMLLWEAKAEVPGQHMYLFLSLFWVVITHAWVAVLSALWKLWMLQTVLGMEWNFSPSAIVSISTKVLLTLKQPAHCYKYYVYIINLLFIKEFVNLFARLRRKK